MCGLAGVFNRDGTPVEAPVVERMAEAVRHRGPDGAGRYLDRSVGLGHRRLAIIDLSPAGQQPMATDDGRYVIVYNGEIYNFKELRGELEALGRRFRSRTDSEVALQAFAEWGEGAIGRFNGMFAFAVWDTVREELFLARDRYGIKPLYYTVQGQSFLFGSEVKALLAHPACSARLDREALVEYLTFQNFFTDRTLFEGVHLLPAGTWLRVGKSGAGTPAPVRYWAFDFTEPERCFGRGGLSSRSWIGCSGRRWFASS